MKILNAADLCPCGTGRRYGDCCGPFISEQKIPLTPEELMRSRYTAYTQANINYIVKTMKSPAADNFDFDAAQKWAESVNWIGLEVVESTQDSAKGIVEFLAYYSVENKKNVLHEISEFYFDNGRWYYVHGIHPNES